MAIHAQELTFLPNLWICGQAEPSEIIGGLAGWKQAKLGAEKYGEVIQGLYLGRAS